MDGIQGIMSVSAALMLQKQHRFPKAAFALRKKGPFFRAVGVHFCVPDSVPLMHMEVSWNGEYPEIIHYIIDHNSLFHYKPSSYSGTPHFRKPPNVSLKPTVRLLRDLQRRSAQVEDVLRKEGMFQVRALLQTGSTRSTTKLASTELGVGSNQHRWSTGDVVTSGIRIFFSMVPKIFGSSTLWMGWWSHQPLVETFLNVLNVCRKQLAGSTCCVHFVFIRHHSMFCMGIPKFKTWLKTFPCLEGILPKTIQSICQHSGFPKIGVPYFNHPFTDGFPPNKNHPMLAWGIPISMETPMNGGCIWT